MKDPSHHKATSSSSVLLTVKNKQPLAVTSLDGAEGRLFTI